MTIEEKIESLEIKKIDLIKELDDIQVDIFKLKKLKEYTQVENYKQFIDKTVIITTGTYKGKYQEQAILIHLNDVTADKGIFKFYSKKGTNILAINNFNTVFKLKKQKEYSQYQTVPQLELKVINQQKYEQLNLIAEEMEVTKNSFSNQIKDILSDESI